jgi:hypothetical protein
MNLIQKAIGLTGIAMIILSCEGKKEMSSINPVNWKKREVNREIKDSLETGSTYLSTYSQIYKLTQERTQDLTATVSIRNTNRRDTIYLERAEYFNTHGELIRKYFDHLIYIAPMETVEIVIDETDQEGGTGANFLFDWKVKKGTHEPLFEAVMISTLSQQGLSFTTVGKRIE